MNLEVSAKPEPQFEPLSHVVREMREATKKTVRTYNSCDQKQRIHKLRIRREFSSEGKGQSYINTLLKEICL